MVEPIAKVPNTARSLPLEYLGGGVELVLLELNLLIHCDTAFCLAKVLTICLPAKICLENIA